MEDDPRQALREAYDARAGERASRPTPAWEVRERDAFVRLLVEEHRRTVLELGAATGAGGVVLASRGLEVVCIDIAPAMVQRCRERGLVAHVMDVGDLRFSPGAFEAVYAMNCLVHVPTRQLPEVLDGIARVLAPAGLFYLGLYGGRDEEGVWDDDDYVPRRFFAHHSDESLRRVLAERFDLRSFRRIPQGWRGLHFQSLVMRNREVAVEA